MEGLDKAKLILQGYSSLIAMKLNLSSDELNELAEKRANICHNCIEYNKQLDSCNECGCWIPAKTASRSSNCPKNHW